MDVAIRPTVANLLFALALILSHPISLWAEGLQVLTAAYPPFVIEKDKHVQGQATAVVRAILQQAEVEATIQIMPWSRAYIQALHVPNTLIYCMARSKEREDQFHWIGIVALGKSYFFSLKKRTDIVLKSLDDARPYTIGTIRNSVRSRLLQQHNFPHIEQVDDSNANAQKLLMGWIDLWAADETTACYTLQSMGYEPKKHLSRHISFLEQGDGYLAVSKDSDPGLIRLLENAYATLEQKGQIHQLLHSFPK